MLESKIIIITLNVPCNIMHQTGDNTQTSKQS